MKMIDVCVINLMNCYLGVSKTTSRRIVIATWSMLLKQPKEWFEQFSVLVVDEAHQADSKALSTIIMKMPHVIYRFGFTGTLDGSKTHELQCRAWFGTLIKSSTTKELMDLGVLSDLEVVSHSLEYSKETKHLLSKFDYQKEIDFLITNKKRNEFIIDTAMNTDKNTLVLFNYVDRHGKILYDLASKIEKEKEKKVFFISGDIKTDIRENIRQIMEKENNIVLFASFGTLAVGVNIKNLHNIIFAHPYKARIRTLQSIGRTIRKLAGKHQATIIDILDNLSYNKHTNFALKHAIERLKIYESEGFKISYSSTQIE